MLHRMLFGVLSRSSVIYVLSSLCLSKNCEILLGENVFVLASVQLAYHLHWIPVRWCFRTGSAGARLRCWRCRSSRGSPGIGINLLSIHEFSEILDTFRHSAIWARWKRVCSCSVLCRRLWLSDGLFASVSFTSQLTHSCMVARNDHSLKSGFDSLFLFLIMSKTNATRAENQSFRYMLQARLAFDSFGSVSQLV